MDYSRRKDKLRQKTKERIKLFDSLPNFLTVVEAKNKETKKFLEDIYNKEKEETNVREYYHDGVLFIKKDEKIIDAIPMTLEQYAQRKAKEVLDK